MNRFGLLFQQNLLYPFFVLFFFTSSFIYASTSHPLTSYSHHNPMSQAPSVANNPEPYYIRIYVHVIRRSDGTGGQSEADVAEALAFMDKDFAEHRIFFVWDHCIDYIDDDAKYPTMHYSIFNVNPHTDGVDIYLYSDEAGGQGGAFGSGNGTAFRIGGMDPTPPLVPRVRSHLMSHEMGHVLSLLHTFEGCGSPGMERVARTGPEANCSTAGDGLCDTPADPRAYTSTNGNTCTWNQQTTCQPTMDPMSSYTPDLTNIMASTHPLNCQNHFTLGQGAKMRDAIDNTPNLQATLVNIGDLTTHIFQNTTFDQDMNMLGNIHVHSGAELLIEAKIGMPEDAYIFVERNARLVADNGAILTRRCDAPHWGGIQVQGNNNMAQPAKEAPLNNPAQAGIVWIDNATIEWARCGVTAGGGLDAPFWGGLIWTNKALFQNNRKAVEFLSYKFTTNQSRFFETTFTEIGDAFPNTEGVTIWETDDIEFHHCTFSNMDLEGIRTYDAGTRVYNDSKFEGNETGISAFATYPMTNKIYVGSGTSTENKFIDNNYHINASLATGMFGGLSNGRFSLEVINNNFSGGAFGVAIDGSSNYKIAGNLLTGVQNACWVYNTGFNNLNNQNLIACNTFLQGSNSGIAAIGENKQMRFLGNDFQMSSTGQDFFLVNSFFPGLSGSISPSQGSQSSPAGNCFTDPGVVPDIVTFGLTDPFTYYHFMGEPNQACETDPFTHGNYTDIATLSNVTINCAQYGGLPQALKSPGLSDLDTKRKTLARLAPSIEQDAELRALYYQTLQEKDAMLQHLLAELLDARQFAAAEQLLYEEQSKAADLAIFGLRLQRADYTAAQAWLNQMSIQDAEDLKFKEIQQINLLRLQNPGAFQLTSAQERLLDETAVSESPNRSYARGMLGLLKDRRFYPEMSIARSELAGNVLSENQAIRVFPVPTAATLSIEWAPFPADAALRLQVQDIYGKKVMDVPVAEGMTRFSFETDQLSNGIYLLTITNKGKIERQSKFVLQR